MLTDWREKSTCLINPLDMISSVRFRIIAAATLCSALGIAIWQLWPPRTEVTSQAKSAPKETRYGTSAEGSKLMESQHAKAPVALTSRPSLSESDSGIKAAMTRLQPKIDAALRASDYPAAHQAVEDALASSGLQGTEKQRLMVSKLGLFGMEGDHAGMLAWMKKIIAVDPTSPTSQKMAAQLSTIEEFANRDSDDPGMCSTCKGIHADGESHLPSH
jgi:hypothetical protein